MALRIRSYLKKILKSKFVLSGIIIFLLLSIWFLITIFETSGHLYLKMEKGEKSKLFALKYEIKKDKETLKKHIPGVAFTEAIYGLMNEQLSRWWGWRPNDIICGKLKLTDNVNNYQLGVLEVVRRAMLIFRDHLSRYGPTYPINSHLDKAFNDFSYSPNKFWLPSSESVYKDALKELMLYRDNLLQPGETKKEEGSFFFPRADNLIYLVRQFKEILGDCHSRLTKMVEDNGKPVSFFKIDDYFYYSYGVMAATLELFKAIRIDFQEEIKVKSANQVVDDIIRVMSEPIILLQKREPFIIIDRPIISIFNNHRAQLNRPLADALQKISSLEETLIK